MGSYSRGATPSPNPYTAGTTTGDIISVYISNGMPFDVEIWWDGSSIGARMYY